MKKTLLAIGSALALFAVCAPLQAQSGCVVSPENPTAVLALVGSAAGAFVVARTRIRARRK